MTNLTPKEKYLYNLMLEFNKNTNHSPSSIKMNIDIKLGGTREAKIEDIEITLKSLHTKRIIKSRKKKVLQYFLGDNKPPITAFETFYYISKS